MADNTTTIDAAAYTAAGTARERVPLPAELFDGTVNVPVLHQAVKAFLANQRQGNAKTKTRGFVTGGNKKPWKQKGTGRARQGSIRAPQWVGGGTVFGPIPRSYAEYVPRQVRALARKSAFNARAGDGSLFVVDRFEYDAPRTSRMSAMLVRLGLAGKKVLILTDGVKPNVYLSARNLSTVRVLPYSDVSAYHILWSDAVVIEGGALGHNLEPIAESEPAAAPKATKQAAAEKTARTTVPKTIRKKASAKPSTTQSAAKKAAKKMAASKKAAKKTSANKPTKKASAKKSAPKNRKEK